MKRPTEFPTPAKRYCIDGTAPDGTYQGGARKPPFMVHDCWKGEPAKGPFRKRERAKAAMLKLQKAQDREESK